VVQVNRQLHIIWKLTEVVERGESAVLVTIVESRGHVPGKTGFKMIVTEKDLVGTVGGGAIEFEAVNIARKMIANDMDNSLLIRRVFDGTDPSGMICGGAQTLVFNLISPEESAELIKWRNNYRDDCFYEISITNARAVVQEVGKDYLNYFGEFNFHEWKDGSWHYHEIVREKDIAYIFGGGHVCRALVPVLQSLDFSVVVLDDRKEILDWYSVNGYDVECIFTPFNNVTQFVPEGDRSYAFIMTEGHAFDSLVLRQLLPKNLKYLGMMGSLTKSGAILSRLEKEGMKINVPYLHSPIGLPIHSHTPAEIAVSIAAQVIAVRNAK